MDKFTKIANEFLKIDPASMSDSLTPADIPDWDSMNYLLFIADLEKAYNISFTMDEVTTANSLGDVKQAIIKRGIRL